MSCDSKLERSLIFNYQRGEIAVACLRFAVFEVLIIFHTCSKLASFSSNFDSQYLF